MKVLGTMYINKSKQFGDYSTKIKDQSGEKMYISVGFKKDQLPTEESLKIEVKDAFLTFYKTKQGLQKVKIQVMEYEKEEQSDFMSVPADETLPF